MFITNKMDPGELLAYFLDLRGRSDAETKIFSKYRHNDDLCPRFYSNVDALLNTYNSYRCDAADIQGITDDGVDVLLRYTTLDGVRKRSGLQIKSDLEFQNWRKDSKLIDTLHAQHSRARYDAKVDDYYIVLCADAAKYRDHVRRISSAFKNHDDVKVVPPEKALAFFGLSDFDVTLKTTRLLCADDPLLSRAQAELQHLHPAHALLLVHLTCKVFEDSASGSEEDLIDQLEELIESLPEPPFDKDQCVVDVINALDQSNVIQRNPPIYEILIPNLSISLCALYFDQRHRLAREGVLLERHLTGLLEIE